MPISGLTCSQYDATKNWLFSCALDKTVKAWDVNFGVLLATFVLDSIPKCILVDRNVSCIFIGTPTGNIQSVSLRPQETFKSINVVSEGSSSSHCFSGRVLTSLIFFANRQTANFQIVISPKNFFFKLLNVRLQKCFKIK